MQQHGAVRAAATTPHVAATGSNCIDLRTVGVCLIEGLAARGRGRPGRGANRSGRGRVGGDGGGGDGGVCSSSEQGGGVGIAAAWVCDAAHGWAVLWMTFKSSGVIV